MGGESKATTTQQSQTSPWTPAQPLLNGILGQLQGGMGNTSLTGAETGAINTLENNSGIASGFAPNAASYATSLFNGGGALDQAGNINQNYQRFVDQTNPLAGNTNYNPYSTPGFSDAITTLTNDITNNVNGQFAAAGRDGSGANSQALARGIAQGVAPVIQSQYNQNIANQQGAAGNLFSAGNTNAGLLSGLQQQFIANQGAGAGAAQSASDLANSGPNAILQAEAARRGIPVQNLGLLANIGIPIAGLGGQSSGSGTTTQQMSPVQQIMGIGSFLGNFGTGRAFPSII